MFSKELNNAALWNKIQRLRELIKLESSFKNRKCWKCGKDLNIYDFLSDNLEFTADNILKLWQNPILEFHCCDCFKDLKINELIKIEQQLKTRYCADCNTPLDIYKFSKFIRSSKINEIKKMWLNTKSYIFCSKFCMTHFFKSKKQN